jgi:DNA-directed RNA polymerase subunit RPC12/RpoP
VFCHKCGATLYESIENLKTPDEIIQSCEGKCPTCGKKLAYIPITIEIKPFLVTNQLNPFESEKKREYTHARARRGTRTRGNTGKKIKI